MHPSLPFPRGRVQVKGCILISELSFTLPFIAFAYFLWANAIRKKRFLFSITKIMCTSTNCTKQLGRKKRYQIMSRCFQAEVQTALRCPTGTVDDLFRQDLIGHTTPTTNFGQSKPLIFVLKSKINNQRRVPGLKARFGSYDNNVRVASHTSTSRIFLNIFFK